MDRRAVIYGLGSVLVALPSPCHAEYFGSSIRPRLRAWKKIPSIVVVSSKSDFRLPLVHQAANFWNNEFAKLMISFRLGSITHVIGTIPIEDIEALRAKRGQSDLPENFQRVDGDVIVALSDGGFNSFAFRSLAVQKAVIAIRKYGTQMVARFAIAHELGHVIGLGHNDEPGMLMYSAMPSYSGTGSLQLTEAERITLLEMYPPRLAG
jgi:hypothetical protein